MEYFWWIKMLVRDVRLFYGLFLLLRQSCEYFCICSSIIIPRCVTYFVCRYNSIFFVASNQIITRLTHQHIDGTRKTITYNSTSLIKAKSSLTTSKTMKVMVPVINGQYSRLINFLNKVMLIDFKWNKYEPETKMTLT